MKKDLQGKFFVSREQTMAKNNHKFQAKLLRIPLLVMATDDRLTYPFVGGTSSHLYNIHVK